MLEIGWRKLKKKGVPDNSTPFLRIYEYGNYLIKPVTVCNISFAVVITLAHAS
jgi:hypothetical protein